MDRRMRCLPGRISRAVFRGMLLLITWMLCLLQAAGMELVCFLTLKDERFLTDSLVSRHARRALYFIVEAAFPGYSGLFS